MKATDKKFTDPESIVELGVGKNMVQAIHNWMKAFGMLNKNGELDTYSALIFDKDGFDPFLENIGTLWFLHYRLVKNQYFDIYSLVFNEFRKERVEFTKAQLLHFLQRKCKFHGETHSQKTLESDIKVFLKNYLRPKEKTKNLEDDFSGLLIELDLVKEFHRTNQNEPVYRVSSEERPEIPSEIILFNILDTNPGEASISFSHLLNEANNPGQVFALNSDGLYEHLKRITIRFPEITFSDDAGVKELQFKNTLKPDDILEGYYEN